MQNDGINAIYFTILYMWYEADNNIFAKSNIAIKYSTNIRNIYAVYSWNCDQYTYFSYIKFIPQVKVTINN